MTEGIHDRFVSAVAERLKSLVVDNAVKAGTHIGPVVDAAQMEQDEKYLAIGRDEGAKLHWGGERLNRDNPGFYLQPALFTEVTNSMRIAREEIFGPVVSVIRYSDVDEAVAIADDSDYGLAGSVWTQDTEAAIAIAKKIRTGGMSINGAAPDLMSPFGGFKQSGIGREFGAEGINHYVEHKAIFF